MKLVAAFSVAALMLAGCQDQTKVLVDCVWSQVGATCTVERTAGEGMHHACWEIAVECRNGHQTGAKACGNLPADVGGKSARSIAFAEFSDLRACDGVKSSEVKTVKVFKGLQ